MPEFFWSDGDSSEGVPHAPNDNAKTAKSNANKWRMNYLPFPYWRANQNWSSRTFRVSEPTVLVDAEDLVAG